MAEEKKAAVYVSFATFKNSIENLAQGIPNQIDRSTFPGFSGGVQNQLFAALKFLGLTTDEGKPTPALQALAVTDENKRKAKFKELIEDKYSELFSLDLEKTTPQELANKMEEVYGVSGDTKEKAVRFFLTAVAYVEIPVSRFLKASSAATGANNGPKTKRRASTRKTNTDPEEEEDEQEPAPKTGGSKAVQLKSGGMLTLSASVDFFQLTSEDRAFVFKLIDTMDEYAKGVNG
jgi:Family of unknown function (DUF5343)